MSEVRGEIAWRQTRNSFQHPSPKSWQFSLYRRHSLNTVWLETVYSLYIQVSREVSESPTSLPLNPLESILRPGFAPGLTQPSPWLRKQTLYGLRQCLLQTLHAHWLSSFLICCEATLSSDLLTTCLNCNHHLPLFSSHLSEELLWKAISSWAPASSPLPRPHSTVLSPWPSELMLPVPYQLMLLVLSVLFWK